MGKKKSKTTITVCTGKCCADAKSKELRRRLKELVKERGLADDVKVKKSECMKQCAKGPVVEIAPAGKVYRHATPKDAKKILKKALGNKTDETRKKGKPES